MTERPHIDRERPQTEHPRFVDERPGRPVFVRERPSRRRPRRDTLRRSLPILAIGATVLAVVAVALAALRTGSDDHRVVTVPSHSGTRPARGSTSSTSSTSTSTTIQVPPATGALAALSGYWHAIGRHDFAAAYAVLAPGTVSQTEAQWVSDEQSTDIQTVRFEGQTSSTSDAGATVRVLTLTTRDARFGCRSWTGSYQMIQTGGHWLIARAGIAPSPCAPG